MLFSSNSRQSNNPWPCQICFSDCIVGGRKLVQLRNIELWGPFGDGISPHQDVSNIGMDRPAAENTSIMTVVRDVELALKLRVYSHKYSIISCLYDHPQLSSLKIRKNCPSSDSTFYKCLKELREAEIVAPAMSAGDMRTHRYSLAPEVRLFLNKRHKAIGEFFAQKLTFENSDRRSIVRLTSEIESKLSVTYYSPTFEIIMCLYEKEKSIPSAIFEKTSTSEASFYNNIRWLVDEGHINSQSPNFNKRKKYYRLSDLTSEILDGAHRRLVQSHLL